MDKKISLINVNYSVNMIEEDNVKKVFNIYIIIRQFLINKKRKNKQMKKVIIKVLL